MLKTLKFIAHEFKKGLPPTVFFFIVFHLNLLIRHLDEESYGITPSRSMIATIAAAVLGKIYLVLNDRHWVNVFADRPLIYSIVWKTALFSLWASLILIGEDIVPMIYHHGSLAPAFQEFADETNWRRFWANHIFLVLWILIYNAAAELFRFIGIAKVKAAFFGPVK